MILISMFLKIDGYSQTEFMLYKNLRIEQGFSARSAALGGATGAMGGDPVSMNVNPAGAGLNYRSQFFFTLGVDGRKNQLEYGKDEQLISNSMRRTALIAPQLGFVFAIPKYRYNKPVMKGWAGTSISFYYSRQMTNGGISQLNNPYSSELSLSDVFAQRAKGTPAAALNASNHSIEALAYNTYLIDDTTGRGDHTGMYHKYAISSMGPKFQHAFTQRYLGSNNNVTVNLAINLSHKWYIGAQVGIRASRFDTRTQWMETDSGNSAYFYQSARWTRDLESSSSGMYMSIGAIGKLTKQLRAGLSYTPSLPGSITFQEQHSLYARYDSIFGYDTQYQFQTVQTRNTHTIYSPARSSISLAWVKEKRGLLSFDADYIQYSMMNIQGDTESFILVNENISKHFKDAWNFRVGGELFHKNTFYRAGFAWYGNNIRSGFEDIYGNTGSWIASLGWGIHGRNQDFDISYSFRRSTEKPFSFSETPLMNRTSISTFQHAHTVLMTYSVKF